MLASGENMIVCYINMQYAGIKITYECQSNAIAAARVYSDYFPMIQRMKIRLIHYIVLDWHYVLHHDPVQVDRQGVMFQ